jgi:glycerate-2-kinase
MAEVQPGDIVLFLISGGSSALLCKPEEGISLAFKQDLFRRLLRSGADIYAMNTVRKHVSAVKGGKLLRRLQGARVINLIISDVPGDDASTIGSGPTTPDPTTLSDTKRVLEEYLGHDVSGDGDTAGFQDFLDSIPQLPETPKPGDPDLPELHTHWVLTPRQFAQQMADIAVGSGLAGKAWVDPESFSGSVERVAAYMSQRALEEIRKEGVPMVLCFHGETEVKVEGGGIGGRNQHLALQFALREMPRLSGEFEVVLMCVGTDGVDGNSDAAGVIVDQNTIKNLQQLGLDPENALRTFDSNTLFKHTSGLIHTGPTGNNVMDAAVLLIRQKPN